VKLTDTSDPLSTAGFQPVLKSSSAQVAQLLSFTLQCERQQAAPRRTSVCSGQGNAISKSQAGSLYMRYVDHLAFSPYFPTHHWAVATATV
jgi:hypothetical protein